MTVGTLLDLCLELENVSRDTEVVINACLPIDRVFIDTENNRIKLVEKDYNGCFTSRNDLVWDEAEVETIEDCIHRISKENTELKDKLKGVGVL